MPQIIWSVSKPLQKKIDLELFDEQSVVTPETVAGNVLFP